MTAPATTGLAKFDSTTRARIAVTVIFFVHGTLIAGWAPHIAAVKDHLALSDALLGWILLCMAAGALVSMQVIGRLIDRLGSKPPLVVATLVSCIAVNGPINADSPAMLAISFFVFGAAAGAMDVATNAQGVLVEARRGKPSLSAMHGAFSLGTLAGAGLAVLMLSSDFDAWQHTLSVSVLGLIAVLLTAFMLLPAHCDRGAIGPRRRVRLSRAALVLGLLGAIAMMAEGAIIDWSTIYMRDVAQVALEREGWAFAGFAAAMALMRLTGDRLNAWIGATLLLRTSAFIAIAGCALMALVPGLVTGVVGATLVGIGAANCVPLVCAAAAHTTQNGQSSGSTMALVVGLSYCGFLLGPPIVGGLSELFSLQIGIGVIGVLMIVVLISPLPGPDRRR